MLGALIVLLAFNFNLSDCASIEWKEPLPTQTITYPAVGDPEEHLSSTSLLKGTINASLSWHFTLSSDLTFLALGLTFNDTSIGGQSQISDNFRDKYAINWIPSERITLIIFDVTTEVNGIFGCEVFTLIKQGGIVTFKSKNQVDVIASPSNIVISSNQMVTAPAKLTLNCSADGKPKPIITWTRLSDNTAVTMPFNITGKKEAGHYRCTADNGVGNPLTKDVFINVLFRPMVTLTSKFYVQREQTASLNCEVEGNPIPSIYWSPCDLPSICCNGQYLGISRVQTSRANFTCTAVNNVGNDSRTTVLIIGGYNIYLTISTIGECENKDSLWKTLQSELVKVFANIQSYTGAKLIDVRCGSLIFELVLRFNIEVAEDHIFPQFEMLLWMEVPPVIKTPATSPTDKTTTKADVEKCSCTIFVAVIVILVAIIVGLIVYIIWLHRRGIGGQKRAYQESSYDNAPGNTHSMEMGSVGCQRPTPPNDLKGGQYAPLNPSTRSWEIPRPHVTIEKIIGKGAFGQVAKATADGLRGMPQKTLVAVKMLKAGAPESDKKDLLSELEVMKTLKPHAHVIKLMGCVTQSEPLFVLIEYVPYGDLLGYLRKSRGLHDTYYKDPDIKPQTNLTSQQLMKFAWQIADGMKYLSSRSIIHRDLAARNVLVGERETCKVTDFGMARDVQQENIYERKTKGRLPVKWTAYEALTYGTYTTKSDVWSFGVLLYEIFTIGGSPYPRMDGRKIANLLQEGYRMPKPQHVDIELYKIMMSCWLEDPNARPTFVNLKDKLKKMENQHKRLINMDIYDNTQLYANVDDLAA
ncbi:fibroblast growth factor receptor 3-like [Montipora capricornis]|uniref:fibroblast growth factor receptor 3-like n=1 Tax=Montipora capricornis TaxID=246305 RepID=UPI0035F12468